MHKFSKGLLGIAAIACLFTGCKAKDVNELKTGTGNSGGMYYKYMSELSDKIKEDGYTFDIKNTAGSAANVRLLQKGFLDLAVVQSDILEEAYNGTGSFSEQQRGYSAVAGLYTEAVQIVVDASSDIYSVDDLYGKAVSVGEEESGVLYNSTQILKLYGMELSDVDSHYMSYAASADAMRNDTIDAFFCTAGIGVDAISELAEDMEVRLVSIGESDVKRLLKMHSGYTTCIIPAGTYKGQTEEVKTLGVKAVLVASDKLSDDVVSDVTDAVFKYADKLECLNDSQKPDIQSSCKDIPIDFHSGAVKYYSSKGYEVSKAAGGGNGGVIAGQDD